MLLSDKDFPLFVGDMKPGFAGALITKVKLSSLVDFSLLPAWVYQIGHDGLAHRGPDSDVADPQARRAGEGQRGLGIFTGDDYSFSGDNGGRIYAGGALDLKIGPILAARRRRRREPPHRRRVSDDQRLGLRRPQRQVRQVDARRPRGRRVSSDRQMVIRGTTRVRCPACDDRSRGHARPEHQHAQTIPQTRSGCSRVSSTSSTASRATSAPSSPRTCCFKTATTTVRSCPAARRRWRKPRPRLPCRASPEPSGSCRRSTRSSRK